MAIEKKNNAETVKRLFVAVRPYLVLVFTIILFAATTNGKLLAPELLKTIINQVFRILLICLGMQFVMAHGSLDFSVGGELGVCMLAGTFALQFTGNSVIACLAACLFTALIFSVLNGVISSYLGLPAFLCSLCFMFITKGILEYSATIKLYSISISMGRYDNWILKTGVLLFFAFLMGYLFNFTKLGKYNKIIGGNSKAAAYSGINVARYKVLSYVMVGIVVGIAAFFAICRERYVGADSGSGVEFDVMVALIFGGMPLSGGAKANFASSIIGAFVLTIMSNGMILWGLSTAMVALIKGLLFLIIVYLGYKKTKGPLPR